MYKPQECQRQKGCCWNITLQLLITLRLSSVHGFIFMFQPNGSVVLDTTLSASVKVAAKQLPWQHYSGPECVSPVSRAFPLVAFEDIACDMFEPRVRTTY